MKKNLFLKKLKDCYESNNYTEFYAYSAENGNFAVGQVIAYSYDYILIHAINDSGLNDGFFIGKIKDICRIATNTIYIRTLKSLATPPNFTKQLLTGFVENIDIMEYFLERFRTDGSIITIHTYQQESIHGILAEHLGGTLAMKILEENGLENGEIVLFVSDIETISFGGFEEKRYMSLEPVVKK